MGLGRFGLGRLRGPLRALQKPAKASKSQQKPALRWPGPQRPASANEFTAIQSNTLPWPTCPPPDLLKRPLTTAALAKSVTVRLALLTPCDFHSTSDDTYIPTKPAFVVTLPSPDVFPCLVHAAYSTLVLVPTESIGALNQPCLLFQRVSCCVVCYNASHKTRSSEISLLHGFPL